MQAEPRFLATPPIARAVAMIGAQLRPYSVRRRQDILLPGARPLVGHLLLAGHTGRYQILSDGRRQITAILVPGDMCDLEAVLKGHADFGVCALTDCTLGDIPLSWFAEDPREAAIATELSRRVRRDESISRQWIVSLGKRSTIERLAHLFCELHARLASVELTQDDSCEMKLPQQELADALGVSLVHLNRSMIALRAMGHIELKSGRLTIVDRASLETFAHFDPVYLR